MEINLKPIAGKNIAISCPTKEDAIEFSKVCKANGLKWASGDEIIDNIRYNKYGEYTCYEIDEAGIYYAPKSYYKSQEYDIIVWNLEDSMNILSKKLVDSINEDLDFLKNIGYNIIYNELNNKIEVRKNK